MTAPAAESPDRPSGVVWLANYDDALAAGQGPPKSGGAPADDLAVLHLLDRLRPAHPPGASTDSVNDSDARYVLRGLHAQGGIGQVWLAFDTELGREVALKTLRVDRSGDPALEARFLHEARITSRLQHPGVVPVYELAPSVEDGPQAQPPFYTMRLVQGRTLTDAIQAYHARRGARTATLVERATLLTAFVSVCQTVAYAHARGVIHRDLKPANVALGDYGEVVVIDWGFAKVLGRPDDPPPASTAVPDDPRQTAAGQVLGTPAYMAPEQAAGLPHLVDERADVYGLGAILYELLTGQPPYAGEDTTQVLNEVRTGPPPRPNAVAPVVPLALEAVCLKALARDPAERYPNAAMLAREVQHWLADEPVEAYAEPIGARLRRAARRHPAVVAGGVVLLFTALIAVGLAQMLVRQAQTLAAEDRANTTAVHARSLAKAHSWQQAQLYLHRIALAERTLAAQNPGRAIALLAECPEDLREWEWHCLNRLCRAGPIVLRGHTKSVQVATFSPDGKTLATAGFDETVRLWDIVTGRHRLIQQGSGVVYDLAFSPDGKRLASACWDGHVRVWEVASGLLIRVLPDHGGYAEAVVYNPDGRTIYTRAGTAAGGTLRAWDTGTGELLRQVQPEWGTLSLAINPDGRRLAVGAIDGSVRLLDAETFTETGKLEGHRNPVRTVAFSRSGRMLASGDGDMGRADVGEVNVWDLTTGLLIRNFSGHTDPVLRVAFGADDTRVASSSLDRTVKVWDVVNGHEALTLHDHADMVRCVAFSPDGLRLASAGADRLVRIWDGTPWQHGAPASEPAFELRSLAAHTDRALGVAFRSDGHQLATVGADKTIAIWDTGQPAPRQPFELKDPLGEGRRRSVAATVPLRRFELAETFAATVPNPETDYFAVAYSQDGRLLATANSKAAIVLFDPETGQTERVFTGDAGHGPGPVRGLAFRADGRELASASWDRTVRIWDLAGNRPTRVLNGHSEPVNSVAYEPNGLWLASAGNDQTVRIWEAGTGQEKRLPLVHAGAVHCVAISADGTLLASAGNDGTIRWWNTSTWKEQPPLVGHQAAVRAVAFSADGRWLASASHDWTVRLWRLPTGEPTTVLRGHNNRVHGLAFAPDSRTLASASYDRTVKLWDVAGLEE